MKIKVVFEQPMQGHDGMYDRGLFPFVFEDLSRFSAKDGVLTLFKENVQGQEHVWRVFPIHDMVELVVGDDPLLLGPEPKSATSTSEHSEGKVVPLRRPSKE